jgi:5-methylcytosine-specific restriction endonuclease McrA
MSHKRKRIKRHRFTSKRITLEELWKRDRGICAFCHGHVNLEDASRDHTKPKSRGGSNKRSNIRLMHKWCNTVKSDSMVA